MPYTKIWIHSIWSTKNRVKIINKSLKPILLQHIKENAKSKEIYIDTINCVEEHVHAVISLPNDLSVSKVMMLIKGESSYWVNSEGLSMYKFEWQDEYISISVSESILPKVREYIKNQEEHHRMKTFDEEYKEFILKYGFTKH
ncbi:MAG TPA: IS200/IS605 family transposase [Ignavibacteria bacterium]|nr:IS200/IS605 family transposase [Ignavibacteria bacterium]